MSWLDEARRSLHGRLALSLAAGLAVVLTASFIALHLMIRGELYGHLDQDLEIQMRAVAEYAAAHPGREDVAEYKPEFRTRAHKDFFQIWDGAGRTLVRSDSSVGRDLPRLEAVVGRPSYHDLALPDGHAGRAVAQIFVLPARDRRVALTVVTAQEIENLERLESRIHFTLLLVAVGTVVAMLLIARFSVRRGLEPVAEFVRSVERVDPDDPNARLNTGPLPSELRPVAASFSAVLVRLLDALAREKRYARNVAHELRNPLAEMRLLADVGSAGSDAAECRATIRDIGAAAAEMEQTVATLLALTRYEAGLETPQPEPVDLSAELRRQSLAVSAAADQRALAIELHLAEEVWVHADSTLVQRLLANLLGNAVAHSPRGSTVQVALNADGDIRVTNPAPHLQRADVPRLGERFFHIESGDDAPHAGLGLSIATAIARVLRLKLTLELQEGASLLATVTGFRPLPGPVGTE